MALLATIPPKIFKKYLTNRLENFTNIKIDDKVTILLSVIISQLLAEIIESLGTLNKKTISYTDFKNLLNNDIELKFISDKLEYFSISPELIKKSIIYSTDLTKYINIIKKEVFGNKKIKLQKKLIENLNNFMWIFIFNIFYIIINNDNIQLYNMYEYEYIIEHKDIMYTIDNLLIKGNEAGTIKNNILLNVAKFLK